MVVDLSIIIIMEYTFSPHIGRSVMDSILNYFHLATGIAWIFSPPLERI